VNVNYRYTAAEMKEIFDDSGAVALVLDGDLTAECALALDGLASPPHLVVIGSGTGPLVEHAVSYDATVLDALGSTETGLLGFSPAAGEQGPSGLRISGMRARSSSMTRAGPFLLAAPA
jgi:hypothetical protein